MSRVRRTLSAWGTEPRDGTPFHGLSTFRFNPISKQFEGLCHDEDGGHAWRQIDLGSGPHPPTWWLRLAPLPYEVPTSFAWTVTYICRPKTLRERFTEFLLRVVHRASAMSAGTAETQSGSGLQPASAVPNGETPND